MHQAILLDFEIARKFRLKQAIADTVGIGGIFGGLRTIPFMLASPRTYASCAPTRC